MIVDGTLRLCSLGSGFPDLNCLLHTSRSPISASSRELHTLPINGMVLVSWRDEMQVWCTRSLACIVHVCIHVDPDDRDA